MREKSINHQTITIHSQSLILVKFVWRFPHLVHYRRITFYATYWPCVWRPQQPHIFDARWLTALFWHSLRWFMNHKDLVKHRLGFPTLLGWNNALPAGRLFDTRRLLFNTRLALLTANLTPVKDIFLQFDSDFDDSRGFTTQVVSVSINLVVCGKINTKRTLTEASIASLWNGVSWQQNQFEQTIEQKINCKQAENGSRFAKRFYGQYTDQVHNVSVLTVGFPSGSSLWRNIGGSLFLLDKRSYKRSTSSFRSVSMDIH